MKTKNDIANKDHDVMDRYLDRLLESVKSNEASVITVRNELAHVIMLMHYDGPQNVLTFFRSSLGDH